MMNIRYAYNNASLTLPPLDTEAAVIQHAFAAHKYVKNWLNESGYTIANITDDLLMKRTVWDYTTHGRTIAMRRDKITPDFLHQIRQIYAAKSDFETGLIPQNMMQQILATIYLHDEGEDDNLLADNTFKFLEKNRKSRTLDSNFDLEQQVWRMEKLTLDRKYTAKEIFRELGIRNKKNDIEITPIHLNMLAEKIEENSKRANNHAPLRDLQFLDTPNHKGAYIFSRNLENDVIDWTVYTKGISSDPVAGYVKLLDRNEGLSTRIGPAFDLGDYNDYLTRTYVSFSINNFAKKLAKSSPDMSDAIGNKDAMMFVLHRIGRTYVVFHPDKNKPGTKGYNIETMETIDFQNCFPRALIGYDKMPTGMMPLHIILQRIRSSKELGESAEFFYETIMESIHENMMEYGLENIKDYTKINFPAFDPGI